jgi:hypothetical protein
MIQLPGSSTASKRSISAKSDRFNRNCPRTVLVVAARYNAIVYQTRDLNGECRSHQAAVARR